MSNALPQTGNSIRRNVFSMTPVATEALEHRQLFTGDFLPMGASPRFEPSGDAAAHLLASQPALVMRFDRAAPAAFGYGRASMGSINEGDLQLALLRLAVVQASVGKNTASNMTSATAARSASDASASTPGARPATAETTATALSNVDASNAASKAAGKVTPASDIAAALLRTQSARSADAATAVRVTANVTTNVSTGNVSTGNVSTGNDAVNVSLAPSKMSAVFVPLSNTAARVIGSPTIATTAMALPSVIVSNLSSVFANGVQVDPSSIRWIGIDAVRDRRDAAPVTGEQAQRQVEAALATTPRTAEAALAAITADVTTMTLSQRIAAAATAGLAIVTAWIMRRRLRRSSAAVAVPIEFAERE